MAACIDIGITTFDMADIYTGVEELVGKFRQNYPTHAKELQIHTKYVPDLMRLPHLTAREVEETIDRSLDRLGVERLDLVQFHWWDNTIPGALATLMTLDMLRKKGKIRCLGLTNFNTSHVRGFVAAGIPIVSHQVQYSLLDRRPEQEMTELCRQTGIQLLCYGTVAGGFLSERWISQPEPQIEALTNRSLTKYKLIIEDTGGWTAFQELLLALQRIAVRHQASLASIASAYILSRPAIAGVIIGAVNTHHLAQNAALTEIKLTATDLAELQAVQAKQRALTGDCYALERERKGKHGRIMRYNLNKE